MPFTHNDGVALHWQEAGEGTPILLIMGHRYSAAMWYPILPSLTAAHRVIWFDNRGTGQSGMTPKVSVAALAADALAVMDAAGVEWAHVFGVSMGGVIAQELALQRPNRVRSLLLGCTGMLTADKPRMPAALRLLYFLPPWVLKLLLPRRGGDRGYGSGATPEAIAADEAMAAKDPFSVRGVAAQAAALAAHVVTREAMASLAMPTLVLHGDEDSTVRYAWGKELADTLPHSRFVTLEGRPPPRCWTS
jgi:3-oxoadipate enol-lactonase